MAVIKAVSSKAGIGQALDYVTKEEKTTRDWPEWTDFLKR